MKNRLIFSVVTGALLVLGGFQASACDSCGGDCGGGCAVESCAAPSCCAPKKCKLFGRMKARRASKSCCAAAPSCCEAPAPTCCEAPAPTCCAAPAPTCCPAPAPSCCEAAPSCCGAKKRCRLFGGRRNRGSCCESSCDAVVSSCGCGC